VIVLSVYYFNIKYWNVYDYFYYFLSFLYMYI